MILRKKNKLSESEVLVYIKSLIWRQFPQVNNFLKLRLKFSSRLKVNKKEKQKVSKRSVITVK